MNKRHVLSVASQMLTMSSGLMARQLSNDWKYPDNWTIVEKREFYFMYLMWAHSNDEDKALKEMSDILFNEQYGPPNWAVTSMLAAIIKEASEYVTVKAEATESV